MIKLDFDFEKSAKRIIERPVITATLALLLCLIPSIGMINFEISSSPRKNHGEHHPEIIKLVELEQKYVEENNFLVMIKPKQGDLFTPRVLSAVQQFTERAWQLPQIQRVDSLSNFQFTQAEEDDLLVSDLVEDPEGLTTKDIAQIKQVALNDPRLSGFLVAPDGNATGINMIFYVDLNAPETYRRVQEALHTLRHEIEQEFPEIETYESGYLGLVCAWDRIANHDVTVIYPLSCLAIFIGLMIFYRNFRATLATMLVAVLSATAGIGSIGLFGGWVSGMTILGALMIAMLALADAVHIVSTATRFIAQGVETRDAIVKSLRMNFVAIALTSITTAIGFISFSMSDMTSVALMGRYVAFGVIVAFILSVTLLPVLLCHCNLQPKASRNTDGFYLKFADYVIRFRWLLLALTVPIMLASMYLAQQNELNDGLSLYVHKSDEFRRDTTVVEKELTGTASLVYDINSGEDNGVNNPAFMQKVDEFVLWLRQQPEVHQVISYTDTMKQLNYNLHGDDEQAYHLPESRDLAAQYLLLYELSLPYGLDLTTQIDMSKSSARIVAIIDDLKAIETQELIDKFNAKFERIAPELATPATGSTPSSIRIIIDTFINNLTASITAIIIIGLILLFTFREIMPGMMAVLMIVTPILVAFSVWRLNVGYIGVPAITSICMVIGIVVDNSVHFLSKYLYARRSKGYDVDNSIKETFVSVGNALVTNTVVLSAGFLFFLLSEMQFNTVMGQLTIMNVLFSLIATLTLLPCLMIVFEKFWPLKTR